MLRRRGIAGVLFPGVKTFKIREMRTGLEMILRFTRFRRSGHTLIEMLMIMTVVGILASIVIPAMSTGSSVGLTAAGRVLASDLRLASDLSIQYSTQYTVTFDVVNNQYRLTLTGPGNPPALQNPYDQAGGATGTYIVPIGQFGGSSATRQGIRLLGANLKTSGQSVGNITFGSLGGTVPARTDDTQIWLISGPTTNPQYVRLTVTAATGQVWMDRPATFPAS